MAVQEEPTLGERGVSRVLYWNHEKDIAVAAVTVDFGRPIWNRQLDDPLDSIF